MPEYSKRDDPEPPGPFVDVRSALRGTERDRYKNFDFANHISADDLVDAAKRDIPTEDLRETVAVGADPILEAFRDRLAAPPGPVHAVESGDFGTLDDESGQVHEVAGPDAPVLSEATLSAKIERCFERGASYLVSLAIKPPAGLDPHSLIVHAATIGAAPNPFREFASVLTKAAVLLAGGPLLLAKVAGIAAEAAVHVLFQHDLDHPVGGLRTAAMRGVLIADCFGDAARGNLAQSDSFKVLTEQHAMVDIDRTVDRFSETLFPSVQRTVEAPPSDIGHRMARPPRMVERIESELDRLLLTDRNLAPVIERAYRVERNGCPRWQPCRETQPCWYCRSQNAPRAA